MEKQREKIVWVLLLTLAWFIGSTYVYTCVIKGFCQNNNNQKVEIVKEDYTEDFINDDEDIIKDEFKTVEVEDENEINDTITTTEEIVTTKEKRVIKCYTYINSSIKENSNNIKTEVEKLEKFLNDYFSINLEVNGVYDLEDREKVIEFQKKNNLDADGVVGPKTLEIINAVYCVKNENKN